MIGKASWGQRFGFFKLNRSLVKNFLGKRENMTWARPPVCETA